MRQKKFSMTFGQRLIRYLLGFGIGMLLVLFMFPEHDWLGWTPNKQVMQQIRESRFEINDHGRCMLACTSSDIEAVQNLRSDGNVDFSRSNVRIEPKRYFVKNDHYAMEVLVSDSLVVLDNIFTMPLNDAACSCP